MIVIVVIAILATVSIVAYNGIQQRAKTAVVMTAVENWSDAIQINGADGATISNPTCLGSPSDFPAGDGFAEGVCVTQNGVAAVSYVPGVWENWPSSRPNGKIIVTQFKMSDGTTLRTRGVWASSASASNKIVNIGWLPQVGGQCGNGIVAIQGGSNTLDGGYCITSVNY